MLTGREKDCVAGRLRVSGQINGSVKAENDRVRSVENAMRESNWGGRERVSNNFFLPTAAKSLSVPTGPNACRKARGARSHVSSVHPHAWMVTWGLRILQRLVVPAWLMVQVRNFL